MEREVWKSVKGFEGFYEVSSMGRVRSVDRVNSFKSRGKTVHRKLKGMIRKQFFDGRGKYLQVCLCNGKEHKDALVHRLVAEAFIDNPSNLPEVNHKDENKSNNKANNLEWCDHKYNNTYGSKLTASQGEKNGAAKFTADMIRQIRKEYIPRDKKYGISGLSKKYGISLTHIHQIVYRKRWGWLD